MGDYLSKPNLERETEDGENGVVRFGVCAIQGWRKSMEDSHIHKVDIGDGVSLFGVFDGHGGSEVAKYIEKNFIKELKKTDAYKKKDYRNALQDCFMKLDQAMLTKEGQKELKKYRQTTTMEELDGGYDYSETGHAGAAANVVLITKTEIYCANAGDCRAVLAKKNGKTVDLSEDHKPDLPTEKQRIERANGYVLEKRVNGNLALSRSLGDFEYKGNSILKAKDQMVTAFPDIKVEPLGNDCEFIIIACDGIWDCMSSQEAVQYIKGNMNKKKEYKSNLSSLIGDMLQANVADEVENGIGTDNMSCLVIEFKRK